MIGSMAKIGSAPINPARDKRNPRDDRHFVVRPPATGSASGSIPKRAKSGGPARESCPLMSRDIDLGDSFADRQATVILAQRVRPNNGAPEP
jgi:hypothetical protein